MGSVSAGFWNETTSHCTVLTQPVLMRLAWVTPLHPAGGVRGHLSGQLSWFSDLRGPSAGLPFYFS